VNTPGTIFQKLAKVADLTNCLNDSIFYSAGRIKLLCCNTFYRKRQRGQRGLADWPGAPGKEEIRRADSLFMRPTKRRCY
jgi:hypothetical protein